MKRRRPATTHVQFFREAEEDKNKARHANKRPALAPPTRYVELPPDVYSEIARHCRFTLASDIVRFSLVCRATMAAFPLTLRHWAGHVSDYLQKRTGDLDEEMGDLFYCLLRCNVNRLKLSESIRTATSDDAAMALFEMQRLASMNTYFAFSRQPNCHSVLPPSRIVWQVLRDYSVSTLLSGVFYYDKTEKTVVPLASLPGVRVCDVPHSEQELIAKMGVMLEQLTENVPILKVFTQAGLRRMELVHSFNMPRCYYELKKVTAADLLDMGDAAPDANSRLCQVIIDGHHLESGTPATKRIRDSLYLCVNHLPHCTPAFAIHRCVTEADSLKPLLARLHVEL